MKKFITLIVAAVILIIPVLFVGCQDGNLVVDGKGPNIETPNNPNTQSHNKEEEPKQETPKEEENNDTTLRFEFLDYANSENVNYDFENKIIHVNLIKGKETLTFSCILYSGKDISNQAVFCKFGKDGNFKTESVYNYVFLQVSEKGNYTLELYDANELIRETIQVIVE